MYKIILSLKLVQHLSKYHMKNPWEYDLSGPYNRTWWLDAYPQLCLHVILIGLN